MLSQPSGFGRDLGVDLCQGPVAVFEDVVLVIEFCEPFSQGQFMPKALMNPEGELTRSQLAAQHLARECSHGGFLASLTADRVEGEDQFVECCGKELGDVVVRFSACARCQGP